MTTHTVDFSILLGKTLKSIEVIDHHIIFKVNSREGYIMYHRKDCCSRLLTENMVGDIGWILKKPITVAERIVPGFIRKRLTADIENGHDKRHPYECHALSTDPDGRKQLIIRWHGPTLNDIDSERVSFERYRYGKYDL